jgi:hypothetical protein
VKQTAPVSHELVGFASVSPFDVYKGYGVPK